MRRNLLHSFNTERGLPGYLTPPVIIVLAIIVFGVAVAMFANILLFKSKKTQALPANQTPPEVQENQADEAAGWKTYKNRLYGFEIKIPPTWHVLAEGKIDEYNYGCFDSTENDETVGFSEFDIRNHCLGDNLVGLADIGITYGRAYLTFGDAYKTFEKIDFAGEKAARFYEEADYKSPYSDMTIGLVHNNRELWIHVNNGQAKIDRNEDIEKITSQILSTFRFIN